MSDDLLRDLRALAEAEGLASRKAVPIMRAVVEIERARAALRDIAAYTGTGPANYEWREVVKSLGDIAREALAAGNDGK